MTPHRIVKARGKDHCTVCLRAIRKVGAKWAHYKSVYWEPETGEYVVRFMVTR